MIKVFWAPWREKEISGPALEGISILFSEPTNFIKHIKSTRDPDIKHKNYRQCPAFLDYSKNIYIVTAPFDIQFLVEKDKKWLHTSLAPKIYEFFVVNRGNEIGPDDPYLVTMPPKYVFYSNEPVKIEILPCLLNTSKSLDNISIIPGTYSIDKWIRPVDFSFEVKDDKIPVDIKEGDGLFCIRFVTENNEKVELERVPLSDELYLATRASTSVKSLTPKNYSLKKLYALAEGYFSLLSFKKQKKCPFNFKK